MKRSAPLILCLSLFFNLLYSQQLPTFVKDSLEQYIERGMNDWRIPAVAVAIIKDGEIAYMKGHGSTQSEGGAPVDNNTLFMIGSNTKAFTALSLAILEQEEQLRLNDKVKKWMPEFELKNALASEEATIADMLCHRIGFETFQGDFTYWTSNLSREDVIQRMAVIDAPYGFRTRWGYCNAAFLTAGQVIPRATDMSWSEAIQQKILHPLNMDRTLMLSADLPEASNAARAHSIVDGQLVQVPYPMIDNLAPAGSMSSSINDMAAWMMAHLNNGKLGEEQAIPANAMQAIRRPYSIMGMDTRDAQETHFYLYGLGLTINDRDGKLVFGHTGGINGFLSSTLFVPEERLGIVVLTNTDQNGFYQALSDELLDAFLGLPYQNYSQKSLDWFINDQQQQKTRTDSLKQVADNTELTLSAEHYTGTYENELYGTVEIKAGQAHDLDIHFSNHTGLIGHLDHLGEHEFLCTFSNPVFGVGKVPFKAEGNTIEGFTLQVADYVEITPYDFKKM